MPLVIEDGTGVAGADSYATVAQLRSFAGRRGASVPVDDAGCEVALILAMDKLREYSGKWSGGRAAEGQALDWPRANATRRWNPSTYEQIAAGTVPEEVRDAQCVFAIESQLTTLQPNRLPSDKGQVVREEVDAIKMAYAEGRPTVYPIFAKVEAILNPLLRYGGMSLIRAIRA